MGPNGVGFISAVILLVIMAVWTNPNDPMAYVDAHGFFIVFIGTGVIALTSVPFAEVKKFFTLIKVVAKKENDDRSQIVQLFIEMASQARSDISQLRQYKERTSDFFLKDAIGLVTQGLDAKSLVKILRRRLEVQKERENAQAQMFKNLGKYPPAAGLMGTVMGMIALLGTLGQEGAAGQIGPAMAVALAATLYGVILANIIILPVADNLMSRTQKSIAKREMIVEGVLLLQQKTNPVMMREMLLSHLPPAMRTQFEQGGGGSKAGNSAA